MSWLSLMDKLFNIEIVSAEQLLDERDRQLQKIVDDLKSRNAKLDAVIKLNEIVLKKEEDLNDEEQAIQKTNDELFEEFMTTPMTWEEFSERHDRVLEMVADL